VTPRTHYDVLGVARAATADELRAAYRARARAHHPDAGGDPALFRRVNVAWRVLGDPDRRRAYDHLLATGGGDVTGLDDGAATGAPRGHGPGGAHRSWAAADDGLSADDDDLADLLDGRPLGETMALEGWWAILPPGTLAAAVVTLGFGIFFVSPPVVALSVGLFVLALGLFVLAPLRAMAKRGDTYPSRRDDG
jgi:hypothetical protein